MKTILSSILGVLVALVLTSCAVVSGGNGVADYGYGYGESTPGIYYTPNYDNYTRYNQYPTISGGSYYSYGGRYEGGGYGYGAPFNH